MKLSIFTILLIFFHSIVTASTSGQQFQFRRISVEDGLSQSTVYSTVQDNNGFMWFGTGDGLNRYDGYDFKIYRHDTEDPSSIAGNRIYTTYTDSHGDLWIGTNKSLSKYNPEQNDFTNYLNEGKNIQVVSLTDISDEELLVGCDTDLYIFNKSLHSFHPVLQMEEFRIKSLLKVREEVIISTTEGILRYNNTQNKISRVTRELNGMDISDIIYDATAGNYFVGTFGNGIIVTDENFTIIKRYSSEDQYRHGLASDLIRVLKKGPDNRLWVGTMNGLYVLDQGSDRFRWYGNRRGTNHSLSHNSVRSIYIDNQQGVWIGTFYGGINYYHPLIFRFRHLRPDSGFNFHSDNIISCMMEDKTNGYLWLGTNESGLYLMNTESNVIFPSLPQSHRLSSLNIKHLLQKEDGTIYIGTHGSGLIKYNPSQSLFRTYNIIPPDSEFNSCYCILECDDGTLILGTLNGIFILDPVDNSIIRHPASIIMPELQNFEVHTLFHDIRNRIWIGTNKGVYVYNTDKKTVTGFGNNESLCSKVISDAYITSMIQDMRNNIWIGSDQGLFRFDESSCDFIRYTTRNGLQNDYINSIEEDTHGRLWLSTNKGLSCFDPYDGSFRNYNKANGIGNVQFNPNSSISVAGGNIYFGGIDGLTYFDPNNLAYDPFSPAPVISDVRVLDKDQSDHRIKKDYAKGILSSINIPGSFNILDIEFAALNYVSGGNNTYYYMLEGADNDWFESTGRSVNYSNLGHGKYTFLVRAKNNDGVLSSKTTELTIIVRPLWYQTIAAKILFIVMALTALFLVIRYYIHKADKKRREELGQEKIKFYINLSHELRTPLSLILSPLEEIKKYGMDDKYISSRIDMVGRNTGKLLHLVNQMLDYRKAESGVLKLNTASHNVDEIINDIFSLFENHAHNRDIDYILDISLDNYYYIVDRDILERILINLLSNAFKFTPDGGFIKLSVSEEAGHIRISIRDNGRGISDEDKGKIFERFYKVDETKPGTGIGLSIVKVLVELHHGTIDVSSEKNKGTEFLISIPATAAPKEQTAAEGSKLSPNITRDKENFLMDCEAYLDDYAPDTPDRGEEKETILIVEDNPEIRSYLTDSFENKYHVVTAKDGREGLDKVKEYTPDLIIADIMMPVMDGIKMCQTIKQNIQTSHIPVIMLTAKDDMSDIIKGTEAGADDYITKPFSVSLLKMKVQNILKSKYRLKKYFSENDRIEPDKITQNSLDAEFLGKALKIVEDNIANPDFSADDFSSKMCMSRSTLHLKMKAVTGESTVHFIRKIRLNHACNLLLEGRYNISEISSKAGFNSPSYFTTTFKKYIGCLPTEYSQIKRNSDENGE